MIKTVSGLAAALSVSLFSPIANACMEHYFYDQGATGFLNGAKAFTRQTVPAVQEKVFEVKHPPAAVAVVDKDQQLKVRYTLPPSASNVRLILKATSNVKLVDDNIELVNQNGVATARYSASQSGMGTITVTVAGENEGKELSYTSTVYVNIKSAT